MTKLSVVVPVFGTSRKEHLETFLLNYWAYLNRDWVELVVVEMVEPPNEPVYALYSLLGEKYVMVESKHGYERSRLLNIGTDVASGNWLLFNDVDVVYPPDFIEHWKRMADEHKVFSNYRFVSRIGPKSTKHVFEDPYRRRFGYAIDDPDHAEKSIIYANEEGGCSCCLSISRSFFNDIGGWNEAFVGWGGEDNEMAERINYLLEDGGPLHEHYAVDRLIHLHHPETSKSSKEKNQERLKEAKSDVEQTIAELKKKRCKP